MVSLRANIVKVVSLRLVEQISRRSDLIRSTLPPTPSYTFRCIHPRMQIASIVRTKQVGQREKVLTGLTDRKGLYDGCSFVVALTARGRLLSFLFGFFELLCWAEN